MTQNYPPEYENESASTPPDAKPGGDQSGFSGVSDNVYMRNQQISEASDLDQAAPELEVNDSRLINRKAAFFFGGIVVSLLLMVLWFMSALATRDDEKPTTNQAPAPVIETPELPPEQPRMVQPVEVVQPPLPPEPVLPVVPEAPVASSRPSGPSLMERRMGASEMPPEQGIPQAISQPVVAQASIPRTSATYLRNPDTLLVRGTYIRCVLETRVVTDVEGFTSCLVSEPVYSINGRRLLLPAGTKLLGRYGGSEVAHDRVAVNWDRAITPTGLDISMLSPGVDGLGGAGHPGQRDAHWANRITTTVLVSLISDLFKYVGEKHGPTSTATMIGAGGVTVIEQPYQSNTARAVEGLAEQAVNESALRRATITINQGTLLNVYVSQDVDFTAVLDM